MDNITMGSMTEEALKLQWRALRKKIRELTGKQPDLKSILFLVGVQELGQGPVRFSKEEKQDLMHIATCKVLSYAGYYELQGTDADGWPQWKSLKPLPSMDMLQQENFLKEHILTYFKKEVYGEDAF